MKSKRLYPVLCAVLVLILASLACGAPATPGASNFYMARDVDGNDKTTVFAPTNDFFVFFDVNNIEPGTQFQSRWYALDLPEQDPNTPFQTIDYTYEEGVGNIYFQLTNSEGWPPGNYKVEIYMSGAKIGEQTFSVQ